jgi:serine/threonine protein phosphatase PrpC
MILKIMDNPYLVLFLFGIGLWGLIKVRQSLNRDSQQPGVVIGNAQTKGKRSEQEDSFATESNAQGVLAVLADGMGGYADGKLASENVVKTFVERFSDQVLGSVEHFFQTTSRLCNDHLLELGQETKIGSTLAAVIVTGGKLYWVSIGDSAIMLYRDGELSTLNKKHNFQTMLEEQYQSGKISKAELVNHPKKKRLTSFLGSDGFREIALHQRPLKLAPNDKIVLCSDGVYNGISELEMEKILGLNLKPNDLADRIIKKIIAREVANQDNATIIILKVV